VAEGYHLVAEAYKANCLNEIITTEKKINFDVKTYRVTYDVMEKISSQATPSKVLGICRQKDKSDYKNNILLINQVHYPGNLGTIIRSAAAFDFDTIVLNNSVDVYHQKVFQATQGMIFHINIIQSPIRDFILKLKNQHYQIIGTDVKAGLAVHTVKANEKRAVLIGNEGDGVSDELLSLCDTVVNIKMNDKYESLNVGVAASIVLFSLSIN
jgi:TrmH family RNA methyltransferase